MTFLPPETTVDPIQIRLAARILTNANAMLATLKKYRQEQFSEFWYENGELRSPSEINDILIEMDSAQVGQSGKFFAAAVAVVQAILAIDPGSLQTYEWYPLYAYTTDENGQIRVTEGN